MVEETYACRGSEEAENCLGDSGDLAHHDSRGLVVIALVPPEPVLDPPTVLPLIIEQRAAPAAHVVFEFYLRILLHIHLDCSRPRLVP